MFYLRHQFVFKFLLHSVSSAEPIGSLPPSFADLSGQPLLQHCHKWQILQDFNILTTVLAKSDHKFVVSKGPVFESHPLPDNMWGQQSVPQIQVLPVVDLVITHGGNNTVTETFFFGKPMIVMPLFGDQPDNAQRIHDKGLGIRLDPYRCSKQELLEAIEKLLNDKELNDKMKNISKRIQTTKSIDKFPKLVEALVKNE